MLDFLLELLGGIFELFLEWLWDVVAGGFEKLRRRA